MKKLFNIINLFGLVALLVFINSCSDSGEDDPIDPCVNGPDASITNIDKSIEGQDNGSFKVEVTGGKSPYMYSIDGQNFQADDSFSDLAPGNYTVTVMDANECTGTASAEIMEIPIVSFANEVNPIIQNNCQVSGCHGTNANIPDYSTYENIKAKADRIKARTSEGTMPPSGPLSSVDVQLIADWVDQGAPEN